MSLPVAYLRLAGVYRRYGFFWYFYQDGTIQHEVKLTGILSTNGLSEGEVRTLPDAGIVHALLIANGGFKLPSGLVQTPCVSSAQSLMYLVAFADTMLAD